MVVKWCRQWHPPQSGNQETRDRGRQRGPGWGLLTMDSDRICISVLPPAVSVIWIF